MAWIVDDPILGPISIPAGPEGGPIRVLPQPPPPAGAPGPAPSAPSPQAPTWAPPPEPGLIPIPPWLSLDSHVESEAGPEPTLEDWLLWDELAEQGVGIGAGAAAALEQGQIIGIPGAGTHSRSEGSGPGGYLWQDDEAVDISLYVGTPILACAAGTISTRFGYGGVYTPSQRYSGLRLHIEHPTGMVSFYQHNSRLVAPRGARVAAGELIAYSGAANGVPHLHFAVTPPFNPYTFQARTWGKGGRRPPLPTPAPDPVAELPAARATAPPHTFEQAFNAIQYAHLYGRRAAAETIRDARTRITKTLR